MSRFTKPFALAVSLLAAALARPAVAATFVVGVENIDYLPHYTVENGEYKGFARAVLDAYAKDRGHVFEYRPIPIARLFREFVEGHVDFKYPDHPNWSQDIKIGKAIVYSDPVVAYIDGVSVRPDKLGQPPDKIHTLGTIYGFTAWDWLDQIKAGSVRLEGNPHFEGLVKQGMWGRVDGVYANVSGVVYQLDKVLKQPGALVFDPSLPHSRSSYLLSTIKHPEIIADFNQWLKNNAARVAQMKVDYAVEKGLQ